MMTGSVLRSRILGLSSFLTALLLAVKTPLCSEECNDMGDNLGHLSGAGSEDPVVRIVMKFLTPVSSRKGYGEIRREDGSSQPVEIASGDIVDDEGEASEGDDGEEGGSEDSVSDEKGSGDIHDAGLQSQLRELLSGGGGIVGVAVFGLSVLGMCWQQQ